MKPFERSLLDEEKVNEKREVFSVSINEEERLWLNELKQTLGIKEDGKALKASAFIGLRCVTSVFGKPLLQSLLKNKRVKYTKREDH